MEQFILTGGKVRELMASLLCAGSDYRIRVRGSGYSMIPFIRPMDTIVLKSVPHKRGIRLGDIVAVTDRNRFRIVVHRVIRLKYGLCQTKGDNNPCPDEWCPITDVIGMVDEIYRDVRVRSRHWQNVLVALLSKTGILNRVLYPWVIRLRNLLR